MTYLIYCKNFCKSHNVPTPSTTIKKKKRQPGLHSKTLSQKKKKKKREIGRKEGRREGREGKGRESREEGQGRTPLPCVTKKPG
jgi:hypothetical protein